MDVMDPPRTCDPEAENGEGHDLVQGAVEEGPWETRRWMVCRDCRLWWQGGMEPLGYEGVS